MVSLHIVRWLVEHMGIPKEEQPPVIKKAAVDSCISLSQGAVDVKIAVLML